MTQISNIHEIEKIIGDMLVKQSQLDKSRIMNGLTPRGADLSKFVTENVKLSYDLFDTVIIFEILSSEAENINFTEQEAEGTDIRENACFEAKITIYGNESMQMAKMLKARFESEKVRYDLLNSGLYFIDDSATQSMNEFVNNTVWPRTDWSFRIACEMMFAQVDTMYVIENADDINIEEAKDSASD